MKMEQWQIDGEYITDTEGSPLMKTTCLNPACDGEVYARGLCSGCYNTARRLVLQGRTTWEKLKAEGKSLKGPKSTSKTIQWLLAPKESKA